jgi:uncharacterized cysteine cluster protein YcgN (CxxCxxCC family)
MKQPDKFWKTKSRQDLTRSEWDSLCARCGRCCVIKFITPASRQAQYTNLACRHLSIHTAQCRCYQHRKQRVPECIDLYGAPKATFKWLPKSCAYRLWMEGGDLPSWHPLITGNSKSTVKAGMSIAGHVIPEGDSLLPYQSGSQAKPTSTQQKANQSPPATVRLQRPC